MESPGALDANMATLTLKGTGDTPYIQLMGSLYDERTVRDDESWRLVTIDNLSSSTATDLEAVALLSSADLATLQSCQRELDASSSYRCIHMRRAIDLRSEITTSRLTIDREMR